MKKNFIKSDHQSPNTRITIAKVDKGLTEKYKDKILFPEKLMWAKAHVKNRDINKEIEAVLNNEKTINRT